MKTFKYVKPFLFVSLIFLLFTNNIEARRYYNPRLGIWLTTDPLSDKFPGWSPYNYAFNNPLRFVDPDGRNPFEFGTKLANRLIIMDAEQKVFRRLTIEFQRSGALPKGADGPADAWRHVATSKYFTENYGATIAKTLGLLNEGKAVIKMIGMDSKEKELNKKQIKMDIKNNKIGRELAGKKVDLLKKANEGEFNTLNPNKNNDPYKKDEEKEDEENNENNN